MVKTGQETVDVPQAPLRPMPEHLYDALLGTLRTSIGSRWGAPGRNPVRVFQRIRETIRELEDIHLAADLDHDDIVGLKIQLWVDRNDLDLYLADDIVNETLRGLGDREILLSCRSLDDDGIRYRFASGTIEHGNVGMIALVGPYARDVSHLTRLGSGQPTSFSA